MTAKPEKSAQPAIPSSRLEKKRAATTRIRHNPNASSRIHLSLTDTITDPAPPAEIYLTLEPSERQLADWLKNLPQSWQNAPLTLYIISARTPIDPVNDIEVLTRLTAAWHLILITQGDDLTSTAMIDAVLRSGIHGIELSLINPDSRSIDRRILNAVKDLIDLRHARGQNLPYVTVRVCGDGCKVAQLEQWRRQIQFDELVTTDRKAEEKRLWG